jgi:hypothetical protein
VGWRCSFWLASRNNHSTKGKYVWLFKSKADVIDHWYALIPGFNSSTKDFYEGVEKELKEREVPGLEIFHVDFAEGGMLSNKREYLRMTRERLVFDICAAPFGKAYFFSCRFAEIPAVVNLGNSWRWSSALCAEQVLLGLIIFSKILGVLEGLILYPFCFWPRLWRPYYIMRNALAMGLKDLDASLMKMPIIGPIYEAWFRKETYYRQDTRLMYCDTVNAVVKAKVEETTGAKGIKLIRYMENCPLLNELYKPNDRASAKGTP